MNVSDYTNQRFDSTEVSDALVNLGVEGVLKNVHGVTTEGPLIGKALTVHLSTKKSGGLSLRAGMAKASAMAEKDTILVVTTDTEEYSAMGGFVAYIAKTANVRGAVVCGNVRDVREIEEINFPVFSLGISPLALPGKISVVSIGEEIDFNGTKVNKGDFVVGDKDGVTVVPADLTEKVVELSLKARARELEEKDKVKELLEKSKADLNL